MKENKNKYDITYLKIAFEWSKLSYCKKKQVGAILVKNRRIISDGYNGTPSGFENICEDKYGYTKWYVLHAEANAILKCAASNQSSEDSILYITLSPCKECSKLILQAGIRSIFYCDVYSDISGLEFLERNGVEIFHIAQEELD